MTDRWALLWMVGLAVAATMVGCQFEDEPIQEVASRREQPGPPLPAREKIEFVEGYAQGRDAAREQGRPMLVFFTADWCTYCHQMADEVFTQDQVIRLAGQFVCVLVDADAEPEVCGTFQVKGYPTVQFLSPRGVPLNRVTGKQPGHELVMAMQTALQAVARRPDGGSQGVTR
ncbi:MAG: thioredoxin family protein [Pirellulales bacterium]